MNMRLKTGEPESVAPATFFNDVCPKILMAQKDTCAKLGGTYGIQLFGDKGGAWTLDFGTAKVNSGVADKVDFYVEMGAGDFEKMMAGKLDVVSSAKSGAIRFEGNPQMFSNLAVVLRPAG
jgi:putative sterol carrier protein